MSLGTTYRHTYTTSSVSSLKFRTFDENVQWWEDQFLMMFLKSRKRDNNFDASSLFKWLLFVVNCYLISTTERNHYIAKLSSNEIIIFLPLFRMNVILHGKTIEAAF